MTHAEHAYYSKRIGGFVRLNDARGARLLLKEDWGFARLNGARGARLLLNLLWGAYYSN